MKSFLSKSALSFLGLLMVLCYSCAPKEEVVARPAEEPKVIEAKQPETKPVETKPVETKPVIAEEKPKEQPVAEKPAEPSNIVAKIGDYTITREELEKKLTSELRARPDTYIKQGSAAAAKEVLLKMIAEKAMTIEGRKQNYLEDEATKSKINQFRERMLVRLLFQTELQEKIKASESEIDEKIKTDPKLNRARAKVMLEREKSRKLINELYDELCKKLSVQKLRDNFPKAVQIHQRLLMESRELEKLVFIRKTQVNELPPEEKNIVLATFDNGKIILKDWFDTLCQRSPPSRPKDLHTVNGVEKLLDRVMRTPIFLAEAKLRGLDKDENLVKYVRKQEDLTLLRNVKNAKYKEVKKATKEEISLYFNENKEKFRTPETVRIDQIWCQDLKTAQKVKEELSSGKDFKSVKQEYSLAKKEKALSTSAGREGMFFDDLWKGEPNEIVGPVKGLYRNRFKWRIVKILEKKPGKAREFSSGVEREVQNRMRFEEREAILAQYRKELLEKYSYEIYSERITDIDPLKIP